MKRRWQGLALMLLSVCASAHAMETPANSLCNGNEQTLWQCTGKNGKTASLCASAAVSKTDGHVQYRYGTRGKIEMEFPAHTENTQKAFRYERCDRHGDEMFFVNFTNGGYSYRLDTYQPDLAADTPQPSSSTLTIIAPNKHQTEITCRETDQDIDAMADIVRGETCPGSP